MLSPLDDYPVHQVATTDRNFYDRYYFNCHPSSPELFCVIGMGQYPNLGVADALAVVRAGDEQIAVRASHELGNDRMDTRVGPFRIEVIEGLRRLRVVLEPRHVLRQPHGRAIIDSTRLAQTGSWEGTLTVDGTDHAVTPDIWQGTREVASAVLDFAGGVKVEIETVLPVAIGAGGGYGIDDWRHGMYLETLVVQGRRYDVGDAAKRAAYICPIDNLATARCEGQRGWGLFEFACFGPHEPSGFTGWDDVA